MWSQIFFVSESGVTCFEWWNCFSILPFFLNGPTLAYFCLFSIISNNIYRRNCSLQEDSKSDRGSRRPEYWPLDHTLALCYVPIIIELKRTITYLTLSFFKNGPSPASFLFIFDLFQTNINTSLQYINVNKCPSSIRHWDSNPQPSECESPPITTIPGLTPISLSFICNAHYIVSSVAQSFHLSCFLK